jgi:predicted permease
VGQIALTVVLVGVSTLTLRSWAALTSQDPGFRPASVVTFRPRFPSGAHSQEEQAALHDAILEGLRATPGVRAAGSILFMPMHSGGAWTDVRPSDRAEGANAETQVSLRMVSDGYFEAMGIELLAGRTVTRDDREETEPVVIVNRTAAARLWPEASPIDRVLLTGSGDVPRRVIGMVDDVRQSGLSQEAFPEIYYPVRQVPSSRRAYAVRVAGPASDALGGVSDAVHAVDPSIALMDFAPLEDVVGDSVSRPRFFTSLLTLFGLTALVLGVVGIWSVTSHAVHRARRDLGIRIALGASGTDLVWRLAARGLGPVAAGVALGLAGFLITGSLFSGLLYHVEPTDPTTLLVVPGLLLIVGIGATLGPAMRVRTLDPAQILREE